MDADALALTEALEEHATELERKHEEKVQKGESVTRSPGEDGKPRSPFELPPLQKPSLMMDPLPMSKEKEAALSRTRPSHLPPKSKEEEEKHLRQYQRMMAAAQEAEKKRLSKLRADLDAKDLEEASKVNLWRQLILPQWELYRQDRRTRELWWRGVPPACRSKAWMAGVGNELELTPDSYRLALTKGQQILKDEARLDEGERSLTQSLANLSELAWPEEKLFQAGLPCYEAHHDVLLAYSMYRPDINLVAGISSIAALLTVNMDAASAFITLANLFNRPTPLAFAVADYGRIQSIYANIVKLMHLKLPHLTSHLTEKLGLAPEAFLTDIMEGLGCAGIGIDTASRVWDVIIFEGDRGFVRVAVATLKVLEPSLFEDAEAVTSTLKIQPGKRWIGKMTPDEFVAIVRDCGKVN